MTDPHDETHAEWLAGGIATADQDDSGSVRLVPIGEGDVTRGGSEKNTYWDRETLREAVEDGAFDGAKLLKGRPGEGHKGMLEQADPDEIVGTAGQFEYEDGVGPVSETAEVLDDHLEKLVEAGLVEVSPDMWRVLGEYDEDLGAYRVEEILDVPYITILDRGASEGATIEPAADADGAEALGEPVLWSDQDRRPELAETLGISEAALEDELGEQLADVTVHEPDWSGISTASWSQPTLNGTYDGDLEAATDAAVVHLTPVETFREDLSLWILNGEGELNINALDSAWTLAPQVAGVDDDTADRIRSTLESIAEDVLERYEVEIAFIDEEQLGRLFTLRFTAFGEMFGEEFLDEAVVNLEEIEGISATRSETQDNPELIAIVDREAADLDELNDEIVAALDDTPFEVHDGYDWVKDIAFEGLAGALSGPEASIADERAESRAGSGSDTSGSSGGGGPDDGSTQHMADPEELQEQLAEVRSERDDLEDEVEDLEEQLSEKEESIENKDKRIEQLEEEIQPLSEMLAELAAEDSPLTAEQLADRFEPSELVETLALDAGWDPDEDDESPVEKVREQLAGSPSPRGEAEGGSLSEEERQQAEQLAGEVMTASDRVKQDGESNRELLRREYDVDPAEYDDVEQLRAAIRGEEE